MGKRFFSIVGGFSYGVAALALLVALILGLMSATHYFGGVDDTNDPDTPKLTEYQTRSANEPDTDANGMERDPEEEELSESDREYFETLRPLLTSVYKSINQFAQKTDQSTVNKEGLEKFLIDQTPYLDRDGYLDFLRALDNELTGLEEQAETIAEKGPKSEEYVRWEKYIEWFVGQYRESYEQEQERIQEERLEQQADRATSIGYLAVAGSAFAIFILFTLVLVLLQIEKNTRSQS